MSDNYLLLIYSSTDRWEELDGQQLDDETREHAELIDHLRAADQLIACSPLQPPTQGRLVEVDSEGRALERHETAKSDAGPVPAGFYLVRCDSYDEAVAIAARVPDARRAGVLVRPLLPLAGIGLPHAVLE